MFFSFLTLTKTKIIMSELHLQKNPLKLIGQDLNIDVLAVEKRQSEPKNLLNSIAYDEDTQNADDLVSSEIDFALPENELHAKTPATIWKRSRIFSSVNFMSPVTELSFSFAENKLCSKNSSEIDPAEGKLLLYLIYNLFICIINLKNLLKSIKVFCLSFY